ncbi:hypothetical protein [Salinibacter ruber]|uniref:hypothetical protein n=1 Tax=Salinibacter ruber TaxID=146919 RepID=UPI002167ED6A|nr:hypothetical protein [Salinibacter ruber]MCS4142546.1 hypothetical protein [Salinibacter ruber]
MDEAVQSARRLRELHAEEVGIALFTGYTDVEDPFTHVLSLDPLSHDRTDKIGAMLASPFEETIFLDTDTYAVENLSEIFDLLSVFDISAAHAPGRVKREGESGWHVYRAQDVPASFPAYNTGVVGFKRNRHVRNLFQRWLNRYKEACREADRQVQDQPAFREVLFHSSDLRIATLPPEYNCRLNVSGYVNGRVKLLHGRSSSLPAVSKSINRTTNKRIYLTKTPTEVVFASNYSFLEKLKYLIMMFYSHFALTMKRGKS